MECSAPKFALGTTECALGQWTIPHVSEQGLSVTENPLPPESDAGTATSLALKSNYGLFNRNNIYIRSWSWNYRGCWHQTCPPIATQQCVLDTIHCIRRPKRRQKYYFSSLPRKVCIGQFARLLLTVVMVAISQAPSPESNPNPPLPVRGKVVHYTTFYLIGGEFVQHRTKMALLLHWPVSTITSAREGVGL